MKQRSWLLTLMFASVVAMMPNAVLFPAEADLAGRLHQSLGFVGWMVTAYAIAYVCATPVLGMLSDFFGRKVVLVAGLCLFAIGGLVPVFVDNSVLILAGRAVMGVGSAGIQPMVDSLIGDVYEPGPKRRRAFAFFAGAIAIAEAMMPFLGGLVAVLWWKAVFVLYSSALLAALLCSRLDVPRRGQHADVEILTFASYARSLKVAARMPVLGATVLGAMLFGVVYFGVSAMLPMAFGGAHNSFFNGVLFLPLGFFWVLGAFAFARVPHVKNLHVLISVALFVLAIATLWLGYAGSFTTIVSISALWGVGSAICTTLFTWVIGDESPDVVRGAMNGIYNAAYVLGFAVGAPLFIELAHRFGLLRTAEIGAILMALLVIPLYLTYRQAVKVHASDPTGAQRA
ncbi:MFS transporter [Alicyclobacillus fastidiosus]|uniref:MFS transporter n=1 Tax=Alicyclobacillus fastidiosus TaxID=392011 RepID=A0ABV5AIZ0_9BACL|nr:MFS transporter [Alicyclobacillus fastidiosus]WEH07818.1 MFS transporter [Alicyclobacillus fastidiosus]